MYGLDKILHSHVVYTVYVNFSEIFQIMIVLSIATCWSQTEISLRKMHSNVTPEEQMLCRFFFRYISDKTSMKTFCKYSYL